MKDRVAMMMVVTSVASRWFAEGSRTIFDVGECAADANVSW
jgi:hypothetical protein